MMKLDKKVKGWSKLLKFMNEWTKFYDNPFNILTFHFKTTNANLMLALAEKQKDQQSH